MTTDLTARSVLHTETIALIERRNYKLTMQHIADGAGVSVHWLRALAANRMQDPSAIRLEAVRDFLTNREARLNGDA